MYQKYIGNPSEAIGKTLYVKLTSGYVAGKVVEYVYPKYGIVGTYKVKRADGKTMSTPTLYCPQVYIDCFRTMDYHDFEKFPCENCPFNKKCGSYRQEVNYDS